MLRIINLILRLFNTYDRISYRNKRDKKRYGAKL